MFRVGLVGDVGSVEMQDLMFTTKGQTPGVTLVEWNLKADKPGSAALWGEYPRCKEWYNDAKWNRLPCSYWRRLRHRAHTR